MSFKNYFIRNDRMTIRRSRYVISLHYIKYKLFINAIMSSTITVDQKCREYKKIIFFFR